LEKALSKARDPFPILGDIQIFRSADFRAAAFGYFGHMWELYTLMGLLFLIFFHFIIPAAPGVMFHCGLYYYWMVWGTGCALRVDIFLKEQVAVVWHSLHCLPRGCAALLVCCFSFASCAFSFCINSLGSYCCSRFSSIFTLVAKTAIPEYKGTALTIVTCIGFAITIVSIQFINYLESWLKIDSVFVLLAPGPVIGLLFLFRLLKEKENETSYYHRRYIGIGLELTKLFIAQGDKVGITGRRCHLLMNWKASLPSQVLTECFDVMGNDNVIHVQSLIGKLGGLDLLIYNSGYGDVSESLDWKIDRQTTLTNVNGFVEIVNYTFNYFVKQGAGQIAATSSIAAVRESSQAPAYSASKAYMSMYMAGLYLKARRIKKKDPKINIVVTDVQPGFVNTKMAKGKGRFWEAPLEKAARQIFTAIQKQKRKVYITRRWALIAWLLKWMPHFIIKRFA
jgi:short-subunit dehydrogenase